MVSGGYDKNAGLPEDIRKIVNRCTEFYPYRRYSNADALRRALLGRSTAATAGFAASFTALGAAVVLAVSLLLPKPAADLTGDAALNTSSDNTEPNVSEATLQSGETADAADTTAQTDETSSAAAETTPQTNETSPAVTTGTTPQTNKTSPAVTGTTPQSDAQTASTTPVISPEGNVVFTEPRIEKAARLNLGLSDSDPFGEEQLKQVTLIVLDGDKYFKSFDEYQQFIWDGGWIEEADVPYIEEPLDLSDLTMFENLEAFALIKQNTDPLPDLSCCPKLKQCVINFCPIDDIYGLRNCTELETLNLSGTPLDDISPLKGCKNLKTFNVSTTYVEDISVIEGNPLEQLCTGRYTYVTPQQIASFPELYSLNICNVDDKLLAEIKNLKKLLFLYVGGNYEYTDMTAFSDMKTLTEIWFEGSDNFVSLEGVQSLKRLRLLNVSSTAVSEIPADFALSQLEQINIANTAITDFTPLLNCRNLKEVFVSEDMLENAQAQLGATEINIILN